MSNNNSSVYKYRYSVCVCENKSTISEGTGKRVNEKESMHACRLHWEHYESISMYWKLKGCIG